MEIPHFLLCSLVVLTVSVLLMWYAIWNTVTNPALRAAVVGTTGRLAALNGTRLLTTIVGVAGVWYCCGWLVGVFAYLTTELIRGLLLRIYTAAAIKKLTADLQQWHPDIDLGVAQKAAAETVNKWVNGGV